MLRCARVFMFFLLLCTAGAGCTNKNKPLNRSGLPMECWRSNHTRSAMTVPLAPLAAGGQSAVDPAGPNAAPITDADGVFFGIAISGGGSRSANFSAACMFHLQRLGLLQKADYLSSVSGGSMTAAYYCLYDQEWNPADAQKRLTHSFATDILLNTLVPWNFVTLTLSNWDRSDLLADSFRKHLFTRRGRELTFRDLRADRPKLLINATDLQSGKPFVFCNESFDRINSNLSNYPIAHAVAASAAVPVLLHHVTLRDYTTSFKQYRHLVDGGVTDNLGIRTLTDMYDAQLAAAAKQHRPNPYPRGAVFIVIDARTLFDAKLSDKPDIGLFETLSTGAGLTSTVLLNRASSATLSEIIVEHSPEHVTAGELRKQKAALEREGHLQLRDRAGRPVYVVHLALSRLSDLRDLPFPSFHESVNSIATYFNISETEAYHLYQAADVLVTRQFSGPLEQIASWMNRAAPTTVGAPATPPD